MLIQISSHLHWEEVRWLEREAIEDEIERKQELVTIYMEAGKTEEAGRLSADITSLLEELKKL
jgi:hypothetical protein